MVGVAHSVRDGRLAPVVLILPLLAVRSGLTPLNRLAWAPSNRPATNPSPLEEKGAATELRPMIAARNGRFTRVEGLCERSFTAFATHELKTPAQIATLAPMRRRANTHWRRSCRAWTAPTT